MALTTQEFPMFTVSCASCGATQLFGSRRITEITNTPNGIMVWVRCFCGAEAATVTGRLPAPSVSAA